MHFYNFNINDFNASTRHLSHVERALYRDLIDMYYSTEKPITADVAKLERLLLVKTDDDKQALQNVLADFFVIKKLKGDAEPCYHNTRIDRELKNYKHRQTSSNAVKQSSNENQTPSNAPSNDNQTFDDRQTAYKSKVAFLVKSLKDKGIKANARMKIGDLQTLFDTHCKQSSNENQTPSNTSNNHQTQFGQSITKNQEPITNNQEPRESSNAPTPLEKNQTPSNAKQTQSVADVAHPTETKKSKSTKPPKFDAKTYPIGDSVDNELWCDFVDMRLLIKKPLTENACKQFAKDFENWANDGLSPNLAIAESIKNSWQGVFRDRAIVKIDRPQQPNQPRTFDEQGNIYATHQPNHQQNHQPHPNSTTAYVQRLNKDLAELKHELYGHPLPTHFGAING